MNLCHAVITIYQIKTAWRDFCQDHRFGDFHAVDMILGDNGEADEVFLDLNGLDGKDLRIGFNILKHSGDVVFENAIGV